MKILFIVHRIPYPPNKGEKTVVFHTIKHLSKKHDISLVSLYDDKKDKDYAANLKQFCTEVFLFYLNPFWAKLRCILSFFLNQPITLGFFYSFKMKTRVGALLKSKKFDFILIYSSSMAQYVMKSEVKKVMHFVDCDSAKWQQYSKSARVPMSLIYAREFKLLRRYEAEIVQNSNLILVVSEAEKKEFAKFVSTDKFIVVTSGVDTDFFPSSVTTRQKNLVFTGVMDYFANVDAVLYFCKEILPLIKEEHSDIKFFIVGRNPTAAVRSLGTIKGVFVTGYVQDIREYLHKAVVSIVLLRIAQGVQNKILESMASGLPVVTTSKAALSLRAQPGRDILIADTPEDFSNKVSMLLKDNSLRRRIGESARKYVEENHN